MEQYSRTARLIGEEGVAALRRARVAVFGIGGVGGYVCEALVRSGLGSIDLIDNDVVSMSNINRQLIATHSTIGRQKVQAMAERLKDIAPDVTVITHAMFYLPETADEIDLRQFDYVVDCIDTVTAKLALIARCRELGVRIISAMGAGNKLDPSKLQVADIYATTACPLARIMRKECRKRGIDSLKVAYSTEDPVIPPTRMTAEEGPRRDIPASAVFVPAAMGLLIASEVVKDLIKG